MKLRKLFVTFFSIFLILYLGFSVKWSWKKVIRSGQFYSRMFIHSLETASEQKERDLSMIAENQWRLYRLQSEFMTEYCKSLTVSNRSDYLWLTALVNDEYAVPAVILGHSIKRLSCIQNMIALVSTEVSQESKETLNRVGWTVQIEQAMDCEWLERRLGLNIPTKHRQRIKGTHTRFHAWRYTNYSKIIYADPDYLLMSNIDELFEIGADYGASSNKRPGLMSFTLNAGLSVFRPDLNHYESIMNLWESIAKEKDPSDITSDSCWDDESLLNYYFSSIGKLHQISHAYNSQRVVYQPVKAFHFVCCSPQKPWRDRNKCRPSRVEAELYDQPVTNVRQASMVFWKVLYTALKTYDIDKTWWRNTPYFDSSKEFGKHRYEECWTD